MSKMQPNAFRAAMPSIEGGRNLSKLERTIAQQTSKAMAERLTPIRPALTALKTEGPRLREIAEKLTKTQHEFDKHADDVNKSFVEFEQIIENRKIARPSPPRRRSSSPG